MNKTTLLCSRSIHPVLNKTVLFIPSFCSFLSIHEQNPQSHYLQGFKGFSTTIQVLFAKKKFFDAVRHRMRLLSLKFVEILLRCDLGVG
ncbi:hypothetical protein, partial [Dialister sp.]|uniref:hypothetical protein n=1 Tax=Dialister sp. TaxID=1955814 RepID=UPI002E8159E6